MLQKYTKSWGWMPPMPHFLFGGRNILNECGVVDGCKWHSLLYKVRWCWLGVMVLDGCEWHSLLYMVRWWQVCRAKCEERVVRFFLAFKEEGMGLSFGHEKSP